MREHEPKITVTHGENTHFDLYRQHRAEEEAAYQRKQDERIAAEVEVLDGKGEDFFRLREEMQGLPVETEEDCNPRDMTFEDFCKWRRNTSAWVRRGK